MDLCEPIQDISNFIAHYQDHKVYGDSFFEYVLEDYIDNDSKKNDEHHNNQDKENMPVHSQQQCCHPVVFFSTFETVTLTSFSSEDKEQSNFYTFQLNSRSLESLFQPPKV